MPKTILYTRSRVSRVYTTVDDLERQTQQTPEWTAHNDPPNQTLHTPRFLPSGCEYVRIFNFSRGISPHTSSLPRGYMYA